MAASRHDSVDTKVIANRSGQAALEFAIVATLILLLMFALVDFGRALNCKQVMIGLTRQGSNLASRGNTLSDSAAAVVAGDAPLDLSRNGEVIVTSVININKIYVITGQASRGGILQSSKIGPGVGNVATVPPAAANMLQTGQTIYVTEIFYSYQPITPIGNFMKIAIPSTLYEAAYF